MRKIPIRKTKKIEVVSKSRRRTVRRVERLNVRTRIEVPPAVVSPFILKPRKSHFALTAVALMLVLVSTPLLLAFEAHIINVTATLIQIDPPILTPPGDIGWYNPIGGTDLTGTVDVFFTDPDPDVTHIYFTYGPGTDPNTIPDPVCGEPVDTDGGGGDKIPLEFVPLSLTSDTVIKAIACDGSTGSAHKSVINTKIYTFKIACEPTPVDFPANLAVLAAGNNSSNDSFLGSANIEVNGDVRSNGNISASGGGPNRNINGNATASGNIATSNYIITGTIATGTATTILPDIQQAVWKTQAQAGGTVNGSLFFPSGTTNIELGPSEIMGNVTFDGNHASVIITGTLYVHGNLIVKQNTTINQDSSFSDQFATIIVDGTIDVANNVNFVGSGSIGAFLLVSNAVSQTGDNAAIEIENDSDPLGDVVLYASDGDVHVNQDRTLLAVFATHGTAAANPAIDFDQNVQVDYRTLPTEIGCGGEFNRIESVLINEFLPDPLGVNTDQGTAGVPLDGEWVELYNGLTIPVDVNGWMLYDNDDIHELIISSTNVASTTTTICPGCHLVVYRDGDGDFALNNSGSDAVRLFNGAIGDIGVSEIDNHPYTYPSVAGEGKSFARIPDGSSNWIDPDPTPGEPNLFFFDPDITPTEAIIFEQEPSVGSEEEINEGVVVVIEENIIQSDISIPLESATATTTATTTEDVIDETATLTPEIATSTPEIVTPDSSTPTSENEEPSVDETPTPEVAEPATEPEPIPEPESSPEPVSEPTPEPEPAP